MKIRNVHTALAALLAGLVLSLVAGAVCADDKKPGKEKDTKAAKAGPGARAVDFSAALGLKTPALEKLGSRIDEARAAHDPVVLASLSKELAAAEEVARKKASIKSEDLAKEAAEMARLRNYPDELKTVAGLLGKGPLSEGLLLQAEKTEKADAERVKNQDKTSSKGIEGNLIVRNTTPYYIRIYVNNEYVGTVSPGGRLVRDVGDGPWDTTKLYGSAPGIDTTWGPTYVSKPVEDFTWRLNP